MATTLSTLLIILTFCFSSVLAADPDPLQDICVADLSQKLTINGFPCKNSTLATIEDFVFSALAKSSNTTNALNAGAVFGTVTEWPGLNTLGLSIARLDFAKGFVTQDNRLFAKVIHKGDVMIIPRALIHWQLNVGNSTAKLIVTLNSQSPGAQLIASTMFGSGIADEVLMKSFFISEQTVRDIKAIFSP